MAYFIIIEYPVFFLGSGTPYTYNTKESCDSQWKSTTLKMVVPSSQPVLKLVGLPGIPKASVVAWLSSPKHKWVFPKIGVPKNRWFIMENPLQLDDFGGKPTIFGNIQISRAVPWKVPSVPNQLDYFRFASSSELPKPLILSRGLLKIIHQLLPFDLLITQMEVT